MERQQRRRDMILASAVSAGIVTPPKAWPEFFEAPADGTPDAFPSTNADMEDFELEQATPESFMHDLELLEALQANQHIALREEAPPPFPRFGLPDPEWT